MIWLRVGLMIALLAALGLSYRHYTGLLAQVAELTAERSTLTLSLEEERRTVEGYKLGIQNWASAYERLAVTQREAAAVAASAQSETRRLNELLGRHDLGALARSKPALVERRLNSGTARALRLLHCASAPGGCAPGGDPPTPVGDGSATADPDPDPPR